MSQKSGAVAEASYFCEHAESIGPANQIKGPGEEKREKQEKSMRNRLQNEGRKKKASRHHFLSFFVIWGPFLEVKNGHQ